MTIALPELKLCSRCFEKVATGNRSKYCYNCDQRKELKSYSASPKPPARCATPMGVELECFHPETRFRVSHLSTFVCRDGSLPPNGGEIKLCKAESKIEQEIADVAQRASLNGCKVDKHCGLHVHIPLGMPSREANGRNLYTLFSNIQDSVFALMPRSRQSNRYCNKLSATNSIISHYSWASMSSKYPTLEVRVHGATLNPWKTIGWLNVMKQLRPVIQAAASDSIEWQENWKNTTNIFDLLGYQSIGYKYLRARSLASGSLTSFVFN